MQAGTSLRQRASVGISGAQMRRLQEAVWLIVLILAVALAIRIAPEQIRSDIALSDMSPADASQFRAHLAGIGMSIMHDGLHGASSGKGWVNELLGGTMYLLGSDAFTWKLQHNGAHHTHTNVDIVDQDIVVWYTFGMHHVVRLEDWPVMPRQHVGFILQPHGFFDQNPTLNLPVPERKNNGHCGCEGQS